MSTKIHLSTIRSRYRALLERKDIDVQLMGLLSPIFGESDIPAAISVIHAYMKEAVDVSKTVVDAESKAVEYLRITADQAFELLQMPTLQTLVGQRDTAVIALLLATGIRVTEAKELMVEDLWHETDSGLGLRVRPASNSKSERYIPYGGMSWVLRLVEFWLRQARISEGPVFRALNSSGNAARGLQMSVHGLEGIVQSYPVNIAGNSVAITPRVLRRTYASRLYEEGIPLSQIQEYLGVGPAAVIDYIGNSSRKAEKSEISDLYRIDISEIEYGVLGGIIRSAKSQTDSNQGAVSTDRHEDVEE